MDIKEIKALKSETEKRIMDQIENFCRQTGLVVESVNFEVLHINDVGGLNQVVMTGLEIKVQI